MSTAQRDAHVQRPWLARACSPRWALPAFCLGTGLLMLAAFWVGGHPLTGLGGLGVMTATGLVFVLGRRSESIRMIAGEGADERWRSIDLRATAASGLALIVAVIALFLWEVAHGRSGQAYANLAAIAGVAYLVALLWLRWRR